MIIFLYGPDSYRRRKKLNEIIGEYKKRHSNLALGRFDLEESDEFIRLQEFVLNRSIFESVKMVVMENIFSVEINKKEIKKFLEAYQKTEDVILLISENNEPPKDFEFLLEKPARYGILSQEFGNLDEERLKFFIKKEARSRGIDLTPQAVNFLANNFKENSWGLINELEKISLIGKKLVDVNDIQRFGDFSESPNLFSFIGLFSCLPTPKRSDGRRVKEDFNKRIGLKNLELLFLFREEPAKIFNILASMSRSPQLLSRLADYDVAVKSGKSDYEEVLLDLALN